MGCLENGMSTVVVNVCTRCNTDAAHLCSQRIREVITIQIQGGNHIEFGCAG